MYIPPVASSVVLNFVAAKAGYVAPIGSTVALNFTYDVIGPASGKPIGSFLCFG